MHCPSCDKPLTTKSSITAGVGKMENSVDVVLECEHCGERHEALIPLYDFHQLEEWDTGGLIPCPLCGTQAVIIKDNDRDIWVVGCLNDMACGIHLEGSGDKEDTIARWNRRALQTSIIP